MRFIIVLIVNNLILVKFNYKIVDKVVKRFDVFLFVFFCKIKVMNILVNVSLDRLNFVEFLKFFF